MRQARILVVEDEPAIRTGLADTLVFHGYAVDAAADGHDGMTLALSGRYDLILLDVMLPGPDGFEICNRIRETDRRQPVIMLTARTSDEDIVTGLSLGADDYVAKPFSVAELVLRVQAVLRRTGFDDERPGEIRFADGVTVDLENLTGSNGGAEQHFTRREAQLLACLQAHSDRPVSREELLHRVWGYARNAGLETRTVDIHIAKLRRKIERDPKAPRNLITVRGAGYKLVPALADEANAAISRPDADTATQAADTTPAGVDRG